MSKMLTVPPSKAIAFIDTPEERKALKPIFPILPDAPIYPPREVMARIIYQEDGTIRAEYLPGVANYTVWLIRKIPWNRWEQTGEGCWLGATVDAEEAEYIIKLTESQWSEGGQYEVIDYTNKLGHLSHYEIIDIPLPSEFKTIAQIRVVKCYDNKWRYGYYYKTDYYNDYFHNRIADEVPSTRMPGNITKNEAIKFAGECLWSKLSFAREAIREYILNRYNVDVCWYRDERSGHDKPEVMAKRSGAVTITTTTVSDKEDDDKVKVDAKTKEAGEVVIETPKIVTENPETVIEEPENVIETPVIVTKTPKNVVNMAKVVTEKAGTKAKSKSKKIDHSEQLSLFG
jgi:hypothetical protein